MNNFFKIAFAVLLVSSTGKAITSKDANNAANAVNADYFANLDFKAGESTLTDTAKKNLDDLISRARGTGQKIDEVKVLAWSDSEFYGEKTKLPKNEQALAKDRAATIRSYLKNNQSIDDVDTYNMAKPAGSLAQFFKTTDSKVKNELTNAHNSSSRALVMVELNH
jgi:hypothetical protein